VNPARHSLLWPAWILALLALLAALSYASEIVVPLLLSILLALTLAPAVRGMIALRIPRSLAALVVVTAALLVAGGAFYILIGPAESWIERAPSAMQRLEAQVRGLIEPIERASEATEDLMSVGEGGRETVVASDGSPVVQLLSQAPAMLASLLATLFLTFLFLLHGDMLLRKFVTLMPGLAAKKELVAGTREAQRELSLYLVTITAINVALGALTAAALYLLGVEDPLLWGGIAALLNYAPYFGAVVTAILLAGVGLVEFHDPLQALAVPGAFVALNLIEGQVVTPLLLGRRLSLDPVVIFVGIMLFGYLWSITGMLIAVPLLACLRIIAQRVPNGGPLALLLGEGPRDSDSGKSDEAKPGAKPADARRVEMPPPEMKPGTRAPGDDAAG
jgi:predicted PurR-regulated permease PerM